MEKDFIIHAGNEENLKDFKEFFHGHDKNTLDRYFRIAGKKESMMVVRRSAAQKIHMQVFIIPYESSKSDEAIIGAIKKRSHTNDSFLKCIQVDPKEVFIFGKLLAKSDDQIFKKNKNNK